LRVSVSHAAVDRFRRARREASLDELEEPQRDGAFSAAAHGTEKTEEGMDARWGPVLSRVLAEEIRRLPPRDRLLLGLYYLQGVPLKTIARQFHVHEATASRWLDGLRKSIRKRIERELRIRHGLRPREIQSLWHWVSEQEEISLEKVLGS
jgi:RNA polymerase sigma factor (sigma-70 family)